MLTEDQKQMMLYSREDARDDYNRKLDKIEAGLRDINDSFQRGANYLLVAHGAGLVGCLSQLKDAPANPHLSGIGFFIVLFTIGLAAAAFGQFGISFGRRAAYDIKTRASDGLMKVGVAFLFFSFAAFAGALIAIVYRFAGL